MDRTKALLTLMRARHTGQVVGIVTVLSVKSGGFSFQSILAIASFLFLSIALFSFDDARDSVGDSIIHPKRPIPKGVFTVNQVYFMGFVFFCLAITSAYSLLLYQFALFLVVAALGLSVIFLKLNSIVRAILTASMVFLLFPFSISITSKSLLFGLIVALPHVAGSITKDFIHRKGDERIGLQPPARWSRFVASSLFFCLRRNHPAANYLKFSVLAIHSPYRPHFYKLFNTGIQSFKHAIPESIYLRRYRNDFSTRSLFRKYLR